MGLRLALFFGLLSLVAADHHQGVGFVPVGKELVYDYKTIVRSGTLEPALFASEYMLHGRLHVQGGQNSTFVRLSDLKYKVHNGETVPVDHFHWGDDFLPIPKDAVALTYPFVIQYDHDGKAMAIATEQTEHVWSRNVKHAIASIMQLDMTEIEKGIKHSHPFFTPEQTIYGECDVTYNVMPRDDKIIVTKFQDPTSCRDGYKYVWLNPEPSGCVAHPEKPMTSDSNRRYVMSKHDDVYCIDRVSATGTIYTYPFRAESDMYFVHVNQTMTLEKIFDIKEHFVVNEQKWVRGLRYIAPETDATTGEFFDFSHGRQEQQNMEEVMQKMRKILSNIVDYIEHNNIEKKIPNIKEYQTINSLLFVLMKFDVHSFEHCFAELKEKKESHDVKMLHIFLNMLPRVGTKASVTFLRNIVRKEKIQTNEAVKMITKFSLFIRHPTEKLLVELEDMMQLGTEPYSMLRRAGILSFATLVHKTFEHEYDDKHVSQALERYVKLFIEKMKSAETYKMKMMWLEGLHNIQFPVVVRYLEPIITGEEKVSEDLRFLALWASMASAVYQPEYAFKLFWPILSDRKLSTEIRVAAYTILMSCPPTMDRYLNMFWLMRHETDEALYHFHYTTLQSLKNTRHTCYREMGIYAKRLLRMSRRPTQNEWANGNYMYDYVDPKYGFGAIYQMLTLTTKDTITMFTEATAQIFNRPFNYISLFVKIKGVDKDVTNKLPINKKGSQTLADIRSTIKTVSESADENLHIEVITLRQGHVTMVHYFDMSNLNHIFEVLHQWSLVVESDNEDEIDIMYEFLGQIMVPSDFGTPVVLSMQIPDITTVKENHAAEKTAGATVLTLNGDFHMQTRMHGSYFLEVYNPFNDLWHGVQKIHSFDFSVPLKYEVTFNPEQLGTIRFSVKRWDDEHAFGIKMYANTHTFIYGEHNNEVLRSFDKEAHVYEAVTRGKNYKTDFTLFDKEVYDIGSKFEAGVFDCERSVSRGSIMRMIKFMYNKYGKNYATMPFGRYLLTLENIFTYMTLSPNVGSCGFYARFVQSVEKPVDRIDFAFRFNQDFGEEKHIMLPEMKINSRLTMSIKGVGGDVLRSWDFNFLLDMDKGHDDNKFKMTVLRTVPNHDDFKINFEGEKKWLNENVSGKMKLTFTEGEKESFVEVDMKGEMSEDQKKIITDKFYTYDECLDFPMYHYDEVVKHDLSCDIAETSLRKYTYDFKIHNTECPYIKSLLYYKNIWRSNHVSYYKNVPVEHPVEKDHFRLEFEYPVHRDEVDMHVTYPEYSVEYEGLPVNDAEWWNWFGLDNFHYSKYFMMMHKVGLWDTCIIDETTVHRDLNDIVDHTVTGDWTVYAEQHNEPSKFVLKVKKVDGSRPLAIRIEEDSHWLEIIPHGDKFTFVENGKELSEVETGYHHEEWYSYKVVKEQHDVLIVTFLRYKTIHILTYI